MVVGCVGTGYVLRVELPVQRRLCSIFMRDVGSPDIHECFCGLTGSQRTPGIWGVTNRVGQGKEELCHNIVLLCRDRVLIKAKSFYVLTEVGLG